MLDSVLAIRLPNASVPKSPPNADHGTSPNTVRCRCVQYPPQTTSPSSMRLALLRDLDWDDARRSWPLAARNPELPVLKYWCMFRSGARSRFAINQACRAGFLPTSRSRTSRHRIPPAPPAHLGQSCRLPEASRPDRWTVGGLWSRGRRSWSTARLPDFLPQQTGHPLVVLPQLTSTDWGLFRLPGFGLELH